MIATTSRLQNFATSFEMHSCDRYPNKFVKHFVLHHFNEAGGPFNGVSRSPNRGHVVSAMANLDVNEKIMILFMKCLCICCWYRMPMPSSASTPRSKSLTCGLAKDMIDDQYGSS